MQEYKGAKRNTGVVAYRIGEDHIAIQFRDGSLYLYTYHSAGKAAIDDMKKLAKKGVGLTTYINQHVKDNYETMIK